MNIRWNELNKKNDFRIKLNYLVVGGCVCGCVCVVRVNCYVTAAAATENRVPDCVCECADAQFFFPAWNSFSCFVFVCACWFTCRGLCTPIHILTTKFSLGFHPEHAAAATATAALETAKWKLQIYTHVWKSFRDVRQFGHVPAIFRYQRPQQL